MTINFVGAGKLGDFIHSLYVVKNICEQRNAKANLYISDSGGDIWTFGIAKAYSDLYPIISKQSYVNKFKFLPENFNEEYINLNDWRKEVATTHAETGRYNKCWSELLSQYYGFEIPKEYKWLEAPRNDNFTKDLTVIHRSTHHHNGAINFWQNEFHKINQFPIFATTDKKEYDQFEFKHKSVPYILSNVSQWVIAINSARYFIGNQSAGFAIASALDVNRLCELCHDPAPFYQGETKYSKNIKWVL